ncbi:MAG: glycosyltransferase family 39 protein [Hymenobacter sp.]|nr:glycosyltransferase family 39 protein [Hymenobacter sp.]
MKTRGDSGPAGRGWLPAILVLGLLLRLVFLLKGATLYYGAGREHLNGDSFSFTRSFLKLWYTGHYTLEPLIPDASFGRLPGYPFFYGLHYLVFGPKLVLPALSVSQLLLDTAVIALLHNMLRRWTGQAWPARLGALLYATYPFAIIWVTVVGTETLNTFVTVAWLSILTRPASSWRHYFLVGLLAVLAFYVRPYMGILLPISVLFVRLWPRQAARPRWPRPAWVLLGFGLLYVGWPVRNYVNYGRVVLVKPASAGYANQREDMQAYLDWLHTWTNDNTTWVEGLVQDKVLRYPAEIFAGPAEERRAYALTRLAARCGGSFHLRRLDTHDYRLVLPGVFRSCNPQIAVGFDSLRRSYVQRHPLKYATAVPLANLTKAFFKSTTIHQEQGPPAAKQVVQRLLFGYRTLLLLLGMAGLGVGWRKPYFWPVAAYSGFIYLYVSFGFRSLEMRYLLQADVLLLLAAAYAVHYAVGRYYTGASGNRVA